MIAALAELVAASRARQGLPPRVDDPGTLRRVAALLATTTAAPGGSDSPGRQTEDRRDRGDPTTAA
jgi:hypothetical protein